MSDLKPCPFCGSQVAMSVLEDEPDEVISAWVHCSCGVQIAERPTEAEAVMQWNARVEPGHSEESSVVIIQRALLDDDSFGTGAEDQDDLEYCALKSAEMIAEALGLTTAPPSPIATAGASDE